MFPDRYEYLKDTLPWLTEGKSWTKAGDESARGVELPEAEGCPLCFVGFYGN